MKACTCATAAVVIARDFYAGVMSAEVEAGPAPAALVAASRLALLQLLAAGAAEEALPPGAIPSAVFCCSLLSYSAL